MKLQKEVFTVAAAATAAAADRCWQIIFEYTASAAAAATDAAAAAAARGDILLHARCGSPVGVYRQAGPYLAIGRLSTLFLRRKRVDAQSIYGLSTERADYEIIFLIFSLIFFKWNIQGKGATA